jgi:hypothetical protein
MHWPFAVQRGADTSVAPAASSRTSCASPNPAPELVGAPSAGFTVEPGRAGAPSENSALLCPQPVVAPAKSNTETAMRRKGDIEK